MLLADITGYSLGLFVHIVAVVLAFGPTFGYGILFSVLAKYPRSTPAMLEAVRKVDNYLVNPGMIVVLLAGIYLMADGNWDGSEAFITIGFLAIIVLLGLQHAVFRPQGRKAQALAERDLEKGDTLSPEFEEISRRLGMLGSLAGLIVVVTIFFMTVKP
jgi:small-conductance mechanosensitive channel